MSLTYQPYNLSLPSYSPVFNYSPYRDGTASLGWNSSYTATPVDDVCNGQFGLGYWRGLGTAFRTTSYFGASVSLDFTGDWTFTVDGQSFTTHGAADDPACGMYGAFATTMMAADNLTLQEHHATLQSADLSSSPLDFYGATVTISAGEPGPKKAEIVDDTDLQWRYEGSWTSETDDSYMWNGEYQSANGYASNTLASYTFQGVSAVILRGLSMCNYGPYTVTLGNQTASFNASDRYWRHAQTVLYFASGLDSNQSYTISLINYDSNYPDPTPLAPCTSLNAAVDTLTLVMDDTASRDALLATISAPPPPTSSAVSPSTIIVAAVLGGILLVMLGLNIFLLALWRRLKAGTQAGRYVEPSPLLPTPWASTAQPGSPSPETSSVPARSSVASTPHIRAVQSGIKYGSAQNRTAAEVRPLPVIPAIQHGEVVPQQQDIQSNSPLSTHQLRTPVAPEMLGDLVTNLSTVLNGHLRQEYLQREGLDGPPEYRDG
ncbi:hypothetical protein CALVIDRAFT_568113 [Calocera viscosa TUFC12733]|uniref:Uncharacterized protein n=1 Tax=Calocera viscosa (strain TUFC12733) TaxID=1330018 RepID=A0A167HEN6_CALVF|nr:hypothetical protein CALVIDRAFT_568113 [Calocera viscosa TUFC12733]